MPEPAQSLYDDDFFRWTAEQARLLREAARRGMNFPLDWENLAGEVESLGRSDRRELRNRIETILVHLLKLAASAGQRPRANWKSTILEQRSALMNGVLRDSPSLRGEVGNAIRDVFGSAVKIARDQLGHKLIKGFHVAAKPDSRSEGGS